mmetsp:Transcript_35083/g.34114  ORF Transcript_35083/g.34114 Transcript_35083/m.34114 type:complete len:183 (-) Transcript_35083:41-589(-)
MVNVCKVLPQVQPYINNPEAVIIDFGCGTGLSGEVMKEAGLIPTYGIDASQKMLDYCKEGVYKKTMRLTLGLDPLPQELAKSCDFILAAGAMGHGHLPPSIMESTLDILKKGAIYTFDIRQIYWTDAADSYKTAMDKLIQEGKYALIHQESVMKGNAVGAEAHPKLLTPQPGYIFVFQKVCD